jgi:hypothetical protein
MTHSKLSVYAYACAWVYVCVCVYISMDFAISLSVVLSVIVLEERTVTSFSHFETSLQKDLVFLST